MADLICVPDIVKRSAELLALGADYIAVHTGVDTQKTGRTPLNDLRELLTVVPCGKTAAAGGINIDNVKDYAALNPGIIIAGGALYNSADIRKAAIDMKNAMGK